MSDYALESFILFCDDMMIAEESINLKDIGKTIGITLKNIFKRIVTWFRNILVSINYFKNATLDAKMNADLLEVLRVSQPRTELNFSLLPKFYNLLSLLKKDTSSKFDGATLGVTGDGKVNSRQTDLNHELLKSITDISESMKAAKSSEQMKRIESNNYKNENMQVIPLGNITSDLKKSNVNATRFQGYLDKLQISIDAANRSGAKIGEVSNLMIVFLRKVIEYYTFRINLLSKYLAHAKASLKGTINNIKERNNENFKSKTKTKHEAVKSTVKFKSNEDANAIKELYIKANTTTTYNEYKPVYDELLRKLNLPSGTNIEGVAVQDSVVVVLYIKNPNEKVQIGSRKLYHSSPVGGLTKISPTFKTGDGVLFSEPRVYAHINSPLDRFGKKIRTEHVYEIQANIATAYRDPEMGRTAVYIKTDKEIPVKEIDYSKFEESKMKEIDLSFSQKG